MALLNDYPLVSVLVPVRNEAVFLRDSLQAILTQSYSNLEVWVIDGNSDDQTAAIVQEIAAQDGRVRLLHNRGQWQSRALNIGLQHAKGEIIVRVDGHTRIDADYIQHAVAVLQEGEADNVGGLQQAVAGKPMGAAIAIASASAFAVPSAYRIAKYDQWVDTVFMGAWRRDLLLALNGWQEDHYVHEDYDLNYRIRKNGGKIRLCTRMKSQYHCRETLPTLWRQYFRYGQGKVKMLRVFPLSLRPRHMVAPGFVLIVAGGALGGFLASELWVAAGGVFALYCLLNVVFSAWIAGGRFWLLWRLPLVFATIHIAWGTGFWVGFVRQPTRPY